MVMGFGADNLLSYLKGHIRADFLKKLKLRDMLQKNAEIAASFVARSIAEQDIIEDLVDMVIDDNLGPQALGLLIGHARERGLSPEDSKALVHGGSLRPELMGKMEQWQDEFSKILYDFLNKALKNRALKWAARKKEEEPEELLGEQGDKQTEEGESEGEPERPGLGVKDEKEIEEEMEKEHAWEKGLIEDIEGMLDREIGDDKKRVVYKAILHDRVINKKNLETLVKETGLAIGTLHNYEQDLRGKLEVFLKGKGLGPKFDLSEEEIVVPDYRVLLKDNKELQVELKGWLKDEVRDRGGDRGGGASEMTRMVLDLYAEGMKSGDIAEKTKGNKKVIENIKTRYFNKGYDSWYRNHVEEVRKASFRLAVAAAAVRVKAVPDYMDLLKKDKVAQDSLRAYMKEHVKDASEVAWKALNLFAEGFDVEHVADAVGVDKATAGKIKGKYFDGAYGSWYREGKGIEEEETKGGPSKVHEKMVEYAFKPNRQRVVVTVEFKSKFDSTGDMAAKGEQDPEFAWEEYRAVLKERSGKHYLHYTFAQKLDPKTGKLEGAPRETLEADGRPVDSNHTLMKMVHDKMEEYVLPKSDSVRGLTPMHHTFSVHYVNTYHGDREIDWQDYHSVEDFVMKHHGIFPKDPQHKKWEDEKRLFEERKVLGPYQIESELTSLITQYERDLKKETDPAAKDKIKDTIKKLKDMIKQKSDLDQKDLDDLINQELMLRHPTQITHTQHEVTTEKPSEVLNASVLIYAVTLPGVGGGGAKDFMTLAKKYGGRNLDRWLEPLQFVQMAEIVNREIDRLRVLHLKDPDMVRRLDGDKEQFQKLLPEFIHDMRTRLGILKEKSPLDYETLSKNRDVKWVDDSGAIDRLLEDVKGKFTVGPATAVVIPAPKSGGAQKLVALFYSYGLTQNPNPKFWLEPGDLVTLAKSFNGLVAAKLDKELGAKKTKGMSEEDWKRHLDGIKLAYEKDLQAAEKLFPEFVDDLKVRRDEFAKEHPLDYSALSAKKNTHWVDDEGKVKGVLEQVAKALREPLKPDEKKQPGVKIIEIGKFEALGGFLRSQLKGFLTLGSRFKRLSVNTVGSDEVISDFKADQAKLKETFDATIKKLAEDKTLTPEEHNALDESKNGIAKALSEIGSVIESHETIPAVKGAKILQSYMKYFSSLFSIFSSMLWYRNKYAVEGGEKLQIVSGGTIFESYDGGKHWVIGAAGDAPKDPEEEKKDPGLTRDEAKAQALQLQDGIYDETHYLSGLRLKPKEAVKEGLTNLRTMLNKFLEVVDQTRMARSSAEGDPAYEEAFKKYVIPEDMLHHSKSIIDKMAQSPNPKVKAMAPIAEKEFKSITENLVKVYREGFTDEDIDRLAKQKSISREKAAVHLRRHQDALTKAAMDGFIIAWSDQMRNVGIKKKEMTPLGNKPPSEYDRMGEFVENHLPELFNLAPPQEEPKEPSPGIPTPKEIRDDIERMWSLEREPTPEEMAKLWKIEADEMGFGGGGGGGKSRARAKAVKTPPPSGTWQQIMHNMSAKVKEIMTKPAEAAKAGMERLVIETLMRQVLTVKKELARIKGDEYIEIDDVIDGLVYLVKQVFNLMVNLKVAPSSSQLKLPPAGAPDFTGTPDVPIDNYAEARKFYDTFVGVTDVINEYLEPHKINIPKFQFVHPERGSRRPEKYFPNGFMETIEFFQKKEHGFSRPSEDKYKPMPHIPGGDEEKMKEKSDHPSFTGRPHEEFGDYRKSELLDFPTQMSADIAAKFAGMDLTKNEFEAVMS
jgi:NACalpha-BTF3-like transcription factor